MQQPDEIRIILSGGGTGGHIFPAVAIAKAVNRRANKAAIQFVGAKGRMEMEKIPAEGFPIKGLWISGLQRKLTFDNLMFPVKVVSSLLKARKIIKAFKPDVVVGTGGYASGPTLQMAAWMGIPTLIQEQNSFPGITNKMLASKVNKICVAYEGMEKYFPKEKLYITGNPVRSEIEFNSVTKTEALKFFKLKEGKITLLVVGGSLGARTINKSIHEGIEKLADAGIQLIWQTGKYFAFEAAKATSKYQEAGMISSSFIKEMNIAYAAADIIVSRAGAIAISELCLVGKPCILVPSPNVTEDHQTKNALALSTRNAAILIKDSEASSELVKTIINLALNTAEQNILSSNILQMAKPNAAELIADFVFEIAGKPTHLTS